MTSPKFILNTLLILTTFNLISCSQKPWGETRLDIVSQDQYQIFDTIKTKNCVTPLDGHLQITIDTPINQQSVSTYLALFPHNHSKFVVTNPLGQPMYIVTINYKEWQIIDVINGRFQQDKIGELLKNQSIPSSLAQLSLPTTIQGGISPDFQPPFIIREDKGKRGLWYTSKNESILIDNESSLLERVLEDADSSLLEIKYNNRQTVGSCSIPQNTNISGLDYGVEIDLEISAMKEKKITKQSFMISPPAHFRKGIILPKN